MKKLNTWATCRSAGKRLKNGGKSVSHRYLAKFQFVKKIANFEIDWQVPALETPSIQYLTEGGEICYKMLSRVGNCVQTDKNFVVHVQLCAVGAITVRQP